jgi:hypothetical protein
MYQDFKKHDRIRENIFMKVFGGPEMFIGFFMTFDLFSLDTQRNWPRKVF